MKKKSSKQKVNRSNHRAKTRRKRKEIGRRDRYNARKAK